MALSLSTSAGCNWTVKSKADPQQSAVYAWERTYADWNRETLTLPGVRGFVQAACHEFGIEPPSVKTHKGKQYAYSWGDKTSFNAEGKNPPTALHEAAHYITDTLLGTAIEPHGPEWLGVFMWLLLEAKVAPRPALEASARSHGLKWLKLDPAKVSKRASARLRAAAKALGPGDHERSPTSETRRRLRRFARRLGTSGVSSALQTLRPR